MMEKILWADYTKSKKNIPLKVGIPLVLVLGAYQFGYGNLTLIMLIIFTIITGAGLKIVQLKTTGLYDRLISAPITKKRLFLEMTSMYVILYYLQFLPTIVIGVYYNDSWIFLFSFLSIALVVLIGIMVGVHANSLGQIHLTSLFTMPPLAVLSIIPLSISYGFPFIYITRAVVNPWGILFSMGVCICLFSVLLLDVSRL